MPLCLPLSRSISLYTSPSCVHGWKPGQTPTQPPSILHQNSFLSPTSFSKKKFMCIPGANSSPCSPDADSRRVDEASIPRLARTCESASLLNLSSARKSDLNTPRLGSHSLRSARSPPPISYPVTLFSSAVGRMPFRRCCPIPGTGGCRRCLALPGPSAVAALLQAWEGATTAVLQAQEGTA